MSGHGTVSKYMNEQCRCTECREATTAYYLNRRHQRYAYVEANGLPSSVKHGYSAYFNWGCRCDVCRDARAELRRAAS
jgi:hypothetical protein